MSSSKHNRRSQSFANHCDEQEAQWMNAVKDHIASCRASDSEDFADVPFNQLGGLGRTYELCGDSLTSILEELNARLAV